MLKYLLLFTIILSLAFCDSHTKEDGVVVKLIRSGSSFDVYSSGGELLGEFTLINTDSLSLATLNDIYELAFEAELNHDKTDKKRKDNHKIVNHELNDYLVSLFSNYSSKN